MTSEKVLYNITGNRLLEQTHVDDIATIAKEYPYFSPAQFLLTLKQKRDSSYNYQYQLQKTSLYFSNQAWLNYLISEKVVSVPDLQLVDAEPVLDTPKVVEEESIFPTSLLGSNNLFQSPPSPIHEDFEEELHHVEIAEEEHLDIEKDNSISNFDYHTLFSTKDNTIEVPTLDVVKQLYEGKPTEEVEVGSKKEIELTVPYFPNILNEPIAVELPKHRIPSFTFGHLSEEKKEESSAPLKHEENVKEAMIETEHSAANQIHSEEIHSIVESELRKAPSSVYVSMPAIQEEHIQTETTPTKIEEVVENGHSHLVDFKSDIEGFKQKAVDEFEEKIHSYSEAKELENVGARHPIAEEIKKVESVIETTVSNPIPTYSFKGFADSILHTQESQHSLSDAVSISEAYATNHSEEEANDTEYVSNVSSMISNQLEDFKKPIEDNAKLEFENEHHHHTIDYFASQGIKIDLTKLTQDKLTIQMRRFTDWLKQMKKQDPNPQDLGTDPELEKAIMNIAKTSIEAREIVTETMADVFIKQGKVNKAIQLYIKLSFLDPQKSTYFATKIQQLKGI